MKMKILVLVSLLGFIALSLLSCMIENEINGCDFKRVISNQWRFVAFDSSGIITEAAPADTILLIFKTSGQIQGKARGLCGNNYYGFYFLENCKAINFYSMYSTKVLCPDPSSLYWDYYFKLEYVNSFYVDVSELHLYYGSMSKLIFKKI